MKAAETASWTWQPKGIYLVFAKKKKNYSLNVKVLLMSSVADPDPGSGAFLTPGPGSGIRNRFFSRSRIPTPYFLKLSEKFLGKRFYNSLKTGQFFSSAFKKKKIIYNFVKFVATKKGLTKIFFSPVSFVAVFGSGIRNG
jgi:hypothetical protein